MRSKERKMKAGRFSAGGGAVLVHAAPRRVDVARQERRGSWSEGIISRRLMG
jgi:hypothetical protein